MTRPSPHPHDPRNLIHEAFRLEGLSDADARAIFFDWALGLPTGTDAAEAARALLVHHAACPREHPMRRLLIDAAERLLAFTDELTEQGLQNEAVYRNSKGTEYRTPVADVLTHVFFHSHYHRGQVAAALRALGIDPPWTDFIVFVRR